MLLSWNKKYFAAEGGGEGGGAGGGEGGGGAPNANDPAVQALIRAAVDKEVGGLKSKNQELLGELAKGKPLLQVIEEIGGADALKELSEIRKKMAEDEDGKLFMSGKRGEYDQRILARTSEKHGKEVEALNKRITDLEGTSKATQEKLAGRIVQNAVMQAAVAAGAVDGGLVDIAHRAGKRFRLGEDGETIEAINDKGEPAFNDKGKALSIEDWLNDLKDQAKHLFKAPSGGGASPSSRVVNNEHRISRADARDPAKYRAAKDAADKAGMQLVIEPA